MLQNLFDWVVTKADGPSLRRFALRFSLAILVLLILTAQFPAALEAAKLPFGYVELRHQVTVKDKTAGVAEVTVMNTGTSKADSLRIRVAAGSGSVLVGEIRTPEHFERIAAGRDCILQLKRLGPQTSLSAVVRVLPASRIVDLQVQAAADQGASIDSTVPTWVERVRHVASDTRSVLIEGASNLAMNAAFANRYPSAFFFHRAVDGTLLDLSIHGRLPDSVAVPATFTRSFSQILASWEFRSTMFAGCAAALLVQWVLGGGMAYLLICFLVPMTIFSYFRHIPFISGEITTLLVAGWCIFPAVALCSERHNAKPVARPEWDAAVGLSFLWGLFALSTNSHLINAPLTWIGSAALLLLCAFDLRPTPYLANPLFRDLQLAQRYWLTARFAAAILIVLGPFVWRTNYVSSGLDFAWLAVALLTVPLAIALRSTAVKATNAEIAAGNGLRFPPIGGGHS